MKLKPVCNDNRLRTSNTKEGQGKKGWDSFKELAEQENDNHKHYKNALAEDEGIGQILIDRFHYEFISSQQQEKENREGNENENDDEHWRAPLFTV